MEWYESEVQALERAAMLGSNGSRPVAFYGSSSIRLWSTLVDDLGDHRIVNLGFGGSTLAACDYFFERLVVPRRPTSLVLYAGDNDIGDGRSPHEVSESLRSLLRKLDSHLGLIPFSFISIKPSPARWWLDQAIRTANELALEQIRSRPNSHYIDIYTPMLGSDGRPQPGLYADDGLHLSPSGYRLWTDRILPHRDTIF
ncbi:SGNH/GDSL hydrolase family protein [Singulisphaera rosea]